MLVLIHIIVFFVGVFLLMKFVDKESTLSSLWGSFLGTICFVVLLMTFSNFVRGALSDEVKTSKVLNVNAIHQQSNGEYFYLDKEYNKKNFDIIEIIKEGKSEVVVIERCQSDWYLDKMTMDTTTVVGIINIKDIK